MTSKHLLEFILVGVMLFSILLTACSSVDLAESVYQDVLASSPPKAVQEVASKLSQDTGIPSNEVNIIDFGHMDWPDTCLGIEQKGMMCMHNITHGYQVILEAKGKEYEFRTDQQAELILEVPSSKMRSMPPKVVSIQTSTAISTTGSETTTPQLLHTSYWTIFISDSDQDMNINGDGSTAIVTANNLRLVISGDCHGLTVQGNNNWISIQSSPSLVITDMGIDNTIIEK